MHLPFIPPAAGTRRVEIIFLIIFNMIAITIAEEDIETHE